MRPGIFAKTFERPTLEGVFEAVRAHGLDCVQYNLACAGLPSLPDEIDPALAARVRAAAQAQGVTLAAVSGTYNMIHPNLAEREKGLRRLGVLVQACRALGTEVVTLCTGTRDPQNMWCRHPDNDSPQAWADLLAALEGALRIAEAEGVTLAFEPEHANVISSAPKARLLLDQLRSPRLKVVLDGANLIAPGEDQRRILDEAVDLLGDSLVLAHAKDRTPDGGFCAAGRGILDYGHYLARLSAAGFDGPLILHGLAEGEVDASLGFLFAHME